VNGTPLTSTVRPSDAASDEKKLRASPSVKMAARFARAEAAALRALPARPLPRREQRLRRRVAVDALVGVDTIRYSVPHRLVRDHVEVVLDAACVRIFHGQTLVATHARAQEPFSRIIDPAHYAGLWRTPTAPDPPSAAPLAALGRDLATYAAIVTEGAR